ncbi:MAG: ferrochelatase [Sulfurimonas sp.]|nr:ferrochelatase [Sulfurimonas sp.]MBU3940058.1 ferrochelatase [bacterium]MBU4025255.1 ferrochelatase [bacterium]MBU4059297.1 ferrochelatase [bacterium]MBU4110373.1 ferrochelatase [bacterium]
MKRAILLMNMGGPNNLDEVEVFLTNMFNDKRIIGAPKPIRSMIAKLITWRRKDEAKANYAHLGGKSPLVGYTQELINNLESSIKDASIHMVMRYTPPFASDVLDKLRDVDEFYAIPLYPHYSSTTTLSSYDDLYETFDKLRIKARVKSVDDYYNDRYYINSIVERIKESLNGEDPAEFELIFSAHGLPKKIIEKGDSYQKHIRRNVYHARKALMLAGVDFHKTHLAYQSRLGPLEWIRPYLDDKLKSLSKKKVIIFPIAFTVDNSETEFELEIEYREKAEEMGFDEYRVAKAPNNHPEFIKCLTNMYENMKVS